MRCIVDKSAPDKTDKQIDKDDRQHAGTKRSLKTFRKFATKLDTENEKNSYKSKQSSGSTGRSNVHILENKTRERTSGKLRAHRQVTRHQTCDSGQYPKDHKLCRAIKFLDEW